MFEERIPRELREALLWCEWARRELEQARAMLHEAAYVPPEWDAYIGAAVARMTRALEEVVEAYRRGEIALDAALARLESEFDLTKLDPPGADRIVRREPTRW